jgi:hypothetical protein
LRGKGEMINFKMIPFFTFELVVYQLVMLGVPLLFCGLVWGAPRLGKRLAASSSPRSKRSTFLPTKNVPPESAQKGAFCVRDFVTRYESYDRPLSPEIIAAWEEQFASRKS